MAYIVEIISFATMSDHNSMSDDDSDDPNIRIEETDDEQSDNDVMPPLEYHSSLIHVTPPTAPHVAVDGPTDLGMDAPDTPVESEDEPIPQSKSNQPVPAVAPVPILGPMPVIVKRKYKPRKPKTPAVASAAAASSAAAPVLATMVGLPAGVPVMARIYNPSSKRADTPASAAVAPLPAEKKEEDVVMADHTDANKQDVIDMILAVADNDKVTKQNGFDVDAFIVIYEKMVRQVQLLTAANVQINRGFVASLGSYIKNYHDLANKANQLLGYTQASYTTKKLSTMKTVPANAQTIEYQNAVEVAMKDVMRTCVAIKGDAWKRIDARITGEVQSVMPDVHAPMDMLASVETVDALKKTMNLLIGKCSSKMYFKHRSVAFLHHATLMYLLHRPEIQPNLIFARFEERCPNHAFLDWPRRAENISVLDMIYNDYTRKLDVHKQSQGEYPDAMDHMDHVTRQSWTARLATMCDFSIRMIFETLFQQYGTDIRLACTALASDVTERDLFLRLSRLCARDAVAIEEFGIRWIKGYTAMPSYSSVISQSRVDVVRPPHVPIVAIPVTVLPAVRLAVSPLKPTAVARIVASPPKPSPIRRKRGLDNALLKQQAALSERDSDNALVMLLISNRIDQM